MPIAILYCRVSTEDQAENGVSLDTQEHALVLEAARRGYDFEVIREDKSGKSIEGREKLMSALDSLDKHKADVLMAVRMDRLSRDVGDVAALMRRSKKKGWGIVLSGEDLDTTVDGKFHTYLAAALAERERDMISLRTKEAMAKMKADGHRFGRKVDETFIPTYKTVLARVNRGESYNSIAVSLNAAGTPTARGGKWHASTIKAIVESEMAKALASSSEVTR